MTALDSKSTRVQEDMPWVHVHALHDDVFVTANGWGEIELCCHHCGQAVIIKHAASRTTADEAKLLARSLLMFKAKHFKCDGSKLESIYKKYCPVERTKVEHTDVRGIP